MAQSTSEDKPQPMQVVVGEENNDRWLTFKEAWKDYCVLEDVYGTTPTCQAATFRVAFGEANRQLLRNLGLGSILDADATDETKSKPCQTLAQIIKTLDTRFKRHENVIHRRYLFCRTIQNAGETVSDYFDRLMRMAKSCQNCKAENTMVRDQLVVGTTVAKARGAIFRETRELSLDDVVAILRLHEGNETALREIETANKNNVAESVQLAKQDRRSGKQPKRSQHEQRSKGPCAYCGDRHPPGVCAAYGHKCARCGKKHHFEIVCRSGDNAKLVAESQSSARRKTSSRLDREAAG